METSTFWLFIALPWLLLGVTVGIAMGRLGHNLPIWLALGVAWGPFSVPLAINTHQREAGERRRVLEPGRPYDGPVDLLLAVDGSPESIAAMERVTAVLGPRIGRLRLVRVVDRDTGSSDGRPELEPVLTEVRAMAVRYLPDLRPEIIVTTGVPATVIAQMAAEEGFDVVAIGARGHGLSDSLLGSTAETLVRRCPVPVVVVRPPSHDAEKAAQRHAAHARTEAPERQVAGSEAVVRWPH